METSCKRGDSRKGKEQEPTKISYNEVLDSGINRLRGFVFVPVFLSWLFCLFGLQGHFHTILLDIKETLRDLFWPVTPENFYDKRKLFTLSDGGQLYIDLKGPRFRLKKDASSYKKAAPYVFVIPGLTSTSTTPYILNLVSEFSERGFNTIVINYRGLAGAKLMTPEIYHTNSINDVREPMQYAFKKFICTDPKLSDE